MTKLHIATIHGGPARGKSDTILGLLKEFPNYKHLSTGAIARQIGLSYGFDAQRFNEFPKYVEDNQIPYDDLIDAKLVEIGKSGGEFIIDSRLGYFFIPDSFKVLLTADIDIVTQRVAKDPKRFEAGKQISFDELRAELEQREESDFRRYLEKYKTDYRDTNNYNLVIDTGKPENNQAAVVQQVITAYRAWLG